MKLKEDVKIFLKKDRRILISNSDLSLLPKEEATSGDALSWWSSFLDLLLYYLPYPEEQCLQKLAITLKEYYNGNPIEVRNIDDFQIQYKAEDTINWYTRETFVYRLLNKAFRQRDVTLLLLFGFFIQNMYRQLKSENQKFKSEYSSFDFVKVYRGQSMWRDEIQQIREGYNKIVNWCFLSTTYDCSLASIYLNDLVQPEDRVQNVLFEIEIDCTKMSYPYGDITHLSHFPNEREILFMVGSVFRIIDITYDEIQRAWLLKLELEEDIRKTLEDDDFLRVDNKTSVRPFLKRVVRTLLQRLDSIPAGDINIIFNGIFDIFPTEKNWLMAIRSHCLVNHEESRYDSALKKLNKRIENHQKALELWEMYVDDIELNCHLDIADIHRQMADFYGHITIKQHDEAEAHYDSALKEYELALKNVFTSINEKKYIYENLDDIYERKIASSSLDNSDRIFEMALKNRIDYVDHLLKYYNATDVSLAGPLKKLAEFYELAKEYDKALINYEKALEIYKSQAPTDHYTVSMLAKKISDIYKRHKNDHTSALKYEKIVRDTQSQDELKYGSFMTAAAMRLKQSTAN